MNQTKWMLVIMILASHVLFRCASENAGSETRASKAGKVSRFSDSPTLIPNILPEERLSEIWGDRYYIATDECLELPNMQGSYFEGKANSGYAVEKAKKLKALGVASYLAVWLREKEGLGSFYLEMARMQQPIGSDAKNKLMANHVHAYLHHEPQKYASIGEHLSYSDYYKQYFYYDGSYMFNLQSSKVDAEHRKSLLQLVLNFVAEE